MAFNYSAFILSLSLTPQLLRDIPADAGFLRDVPTELGAAVTVVRANKTNNTQQTR